MRSPLLQIPNKLEFFTGEGQHKVFLVDVAQSEVAVCVYRQGVDNQKDLTRDLRRSVEDPPKKTTKSPLKIRIQNGKVRCESAILVAIEKGQRLRLFWAIDF